MSALRDIRYARFSSRTLRNLMRRLYRPGHAYRIRLGPLRGLRFSYQPSVTLHAVMGLLDSETLSSLRHIVLDSGLVPSDATVADVGANVGYYTLWLAKLAVPNGHVYSFEPGPEPRKILRENIRVNQIGNVDVIECACGDRVGNAAFFIANDHHSSSLNANWAGNQAREVSVPMCTLDHFFAPASQRRAPDFLKMDIEGGGTLALPGCRRILTEKRPLVLIESHTPAEDGAISKVLVDLAYRAYRMNNREWVRKPKAVHPDYDGVWGTMLLVPEESANRVRAVTQRHCASN
jgi:FkbM family methyltransferase